MFDLKSMSISKKVHIPLILSMLIGTIIILVNYFYLIADLKRDVYENETKNLKSFFVESLESKKDIGITNAINISQNFSVVNALANNDREIAIKGLDHFSAELKKSTKYNNIKVHIHDANISSFYVHGILANMEMILAVFVKL